MKIRSIEVHMVETKHLNRKTDKRIKARPLVTHLITCSAFFLFGAFFALLWILTPGDLTRIAAAFWGIK